MFSAIIVISVFLPTSSTQPSCSSLPAASTALLQKQAKRSLEQNVILNSVSELTAFAPDLVDLGVKLFGSSEQLDAFLNHTDAPVDLLYNSVTMKLKQNEGDNSLSRLGIEASDGYGIQRVVEKDGVMIDAGGNLGAITISVAKRFPSLQVLTIEPVPSTYFLLRLNMRLNGVLELQEHEFGLKKTGVLAMQRALSTKSLDVEMQYSTVSSQDSLPKGQDDLWAKSVNSTQSGDWARLEGTWHTVKVKTMMLPLFLEEHNVHQVRFLKMDCEGCEFDVMPAMRDFVSNRTKVQRFAAEIHRSKVIGAEDPLNTLAFDAALSARGCQNSENMTYFPDGLYQC